MSLHLWARDALGGVIALAACSAALATAKDPKLRWLSLATAASCVLLTALGSLTVGARFGEDVFARAPEPLAETTAALEPLRSVALPDTIVDLVLSPSGTHFFARLDSGESYGPAGFLVETSAGLERVDVLALDFVDDDTVATVVEVEVDVDVDVEEGEGNGNGLVLSLPGLSVPLPALRPVELSVDAREGAWQIVGYDADLYDTIVLRGRLDSDRIETRRFVLPDSDTSVVDAVSFSGWALSYDYLYPDAFHRAASLGFAGLTTRGMATELAVRRHDGDTRRVGLTLLYPSCYEAGLSEPLFVCSVGHGGATRLYTIDPRSPAFAPFGSVRFERHLDGPITRGRLALTGWHEAPLLVDIARARVVRVPLADAPWEIVAWSGDTVANATYQYDTETTTVTLYRLDVAPPLH